MKQKETLSKSHLNGLIILNSCVNNANINAALENV